MLEIYWARGCPMIGVDDSGRAWRLGHNREPTVLGSLYTLCPHPLAAKLDSAVLMKLGGDWHRGYLVGLYSCLRIDTVVALVSIQAGTFWEPANQVFTLCD